MDRPGMVEVARALRALDGAASHEAGLAEAFQGVAEALNADHFYLVRIGEGELEFALPDFRAEMLGAYYKDGLAGRDDSGPRPVSRLAATTR